MDIKIYFDEDNEYSEFNYNNKDSNNHIYKINIYGITRLNQEFDESANNGEIFYVEPNLIIVEEVNKHNIINAILGVCKEFNFLSQLKTEDDIDLSNYINVY